MRETRRKAKFEGKLERKSEWGVIGTEGTDKV